MKIISLLIVVLLSACSEDDAPSCFVQGPVRVSAEAFVGAAPTGKAACFDPGTYVLFGPFDGITDGDEPVREGLNFVVVADADACELWVVFNDEASLTVYRTREDQFEGYGSFFLSEPIECENALVDAVVTIESR